MLLVKNLIIILNNFLFHSTNDSICFSLYIPLPHLTNKEGALNTFNEKCTDYNFEYKVFFFQNTFFFISDCKQHCNLSIDI